MLVSRSSENLYRFRGGLMRAASAQGWQCTAAADDGDGFDERIRKECQSAFVHVPVKTEGVAILNELTFGWRLFRLFRAARPDVVHLYTIRAVIFGGLAARLAGVPVRVATITGLGYAFTEARRVMRWVASRLYRLTLSGMHWVYFQNRDDRELFVSWGLVHPAHTSVIAGSGVDLEHYAVPMEDKAPDKDTVGVLFIGRLLRDKGVRELLQAAETVTGSHPDVEFSLLGSFDAHNPTSIDKSDLDRWIERGIVRWHGKAPDVRPFLADADIVVLPSYREGTPRSLLEAAAMGRPIVAADVPGSRDVVVHEETGLLVPVRDAGALAEAIVALVEDPAARRRMGAAGRRYVEARYDEREVVRQTLEKYAELQGR